MPLSNPNHHLWRNGRLWWVAFTVLYDGWRQERVRRSLATADLDEARRRRDDLLHQYAAQQNAEVVAFRYCRPEAAPFQPDRGAFGVRPAAFGFDAESRNRAPFGVDREPSEAAGRA